MANNLGFEYTLNVNERATRQNLNTFIRNTFGEGKNAKLSVPIKLDISNSIKDIDFKKIQKDIDDNVGNNLKVKAKIVIDTNNIKNQLTSKIGEIEKDLKFKVGLEIDPSAINLIAGTVDVMKTLNAEIDKVKNNMKELGKNLTINIGDVHLGKQYDEILETSKEIKEENKETEASLEEQLNIQKRILEEKRNQMKQTEKDIKAEKDRLDLAKQRKANNDKLIEQEKEIRKQASDIDAQIKSEKDKQKTYEKQNDALKKQSQEQKKLADDLKKTNEEIKKLENDKASAQQRVNLAKEEEQRRTNNLATMKKENEALKEKLANLQKIAKATDVATTSDKTNKTSKGTSIKQQANDTIKQVTNVSEKRIEQEKQVTNEIEKQSEAQIKAINNVTEAEDKANKARAKSDKKTTSSTSSTGKKGRRNLYEDVQSADIAKAIRNETVEGVRSLEEEKAEMRRLGDMVANERGLLQQVTECLERNKELTKENADEVQNLLTKLADEKTLIQEAAGNRDYVNYADFKNALKKYEADPSDKNLEKLEWQMEKWGKIGAMYEYRKDVQEAINTLQKQYNIEAQRSIEIDKKQNQINEARTSRATNMQSKAAENKIGFDAKKLKYRDAGSFVKEEMYGFSAEELAKAIEKYDDALQPFMDASGFHIDYGKTDDYIADIKDKVEKLATAINNTTDTQKIETYNAKIEKLNRNMKILQKTVNTYEHLDALMKMKEGVTFDLGTENKNNTDINKVLNLKEIVSDFTQYSEGVNLAREQTSKMRQDLSWLAKDFDKLVAEKSMDEEKWQSLADKVQQYKKELGVTEDQIKQFINTKNAEIEQGNEHLAKLKEVQKTFKHGTNEYKECTRVIRNYNDALKDNEPLTDIIKDMKELINILDAGKDSLNNFSDNTNNENTVKIVKKQKMSVEELAKQMENQDIMAEKVYLANKKNEQVMIDINQVIDKQRNTWKDLTGEVEKYYSKLSSEEVDKGLSIIRAEDKAEKNPNYRISTYMTKSLDAENLSLKEKISLLAEYEAKSKVIEVLKRKVNQVEKYGLSYLEDEEDGIQLLNQKKQEQINKTINHTKATQNNNKALKEQADVSKNIAKIDVTQQNKNMQELFRSVALGDNNLENLSELLKLVKNEVEKFSLALSSGTGLTDEARKSMYALKESFTKAEQALTTMEQKTGNANFTIEKGSKGFNAQKDVLAKLYKEIYNVSESTQQSNKVEEKANQIAEDKVNNTNKVTEAIKQETNAIDEKTMALKSMALQAGIAEEKLDDLLMRIGNVVGSGKRLSKTEMGKLAKDFPTEDLASALERKSKLVSEGRKGKYNQTDKYKQYKGQLEALVNNYTDNAFDLFQKIYDEVKKVDKTVEQTNKKVTRTSKPKKQEVTQQNEVAKAVKNVTEVKQEQDSISESLEAKQQARIREQVQQIENMSDAQQRFNAILELTGLNYDNIYKKHEKEIKTLDKAMIWKATGNAAMDMGYENNIGGGDKTTYVGQYMKNKNTDMNDKKVNTDMLSEYYAKKDILGEYEKILEQYDYANKTAEELLYDISEKGLRDSLAIETALQKTTESEKVVLEDIARIKQEIAKEGKVDLETNNKQLNQLKEQLKAYEQGSRVYSKYIEDARKQALQMVRDGRQEVTDKTVNQAMFKILGNNDTNIAYDKQIGNTNEFDKITKRLGFNKQEAQEFYDIYFKVNQLKKEISDLESKSGDSYYSRVLENLEKEKAVLEENKNYLMSLLPKQQEQVQVQQQQAEAVIETAQATEKLAKAQKKIEANLINSDSLNGGNAVDKEHYLPDAAIDSVNVLGNAVDEQQALFDKAIETNNKQNDIIAEEATLSEKISKDKTKQIQQEEKVAETVSESVDNYKQAYEEVMRLIEASKEYSKLSEDSSEKIDFQDLRGRAETIDDDDIAQWKEMYQLSLALGDEMELNINRERRLAKEKQTSLEKTKALLSDGRTTEQEALEKESLAIEENVSAKKQETNATEQLSKAQNESSNKTEEIAKSKNKVAKASKNVTNALKEEQQALVVSTNVKDHIQATLAAIDKINDSATFKKKKKEDSTIQDMFDELKREANINKSSGVLGIDYWDGLIDRIKIFATEMVKMKAKTIDSAVNPLIYKDGGTTSTSKPLSMEDFKAQQEEKAKQRQIRQQEKNAQKLKEQREEAEALETVLKQLEDSIVNNPHTQLLKVYEDITKITDAQERFNKILEATGLNYDEIYSKALKSERTHAQNSGGIDIDEIFTKQLASFNRDDNPYNTLNYMSVANIKGFNDRVDYVAEYRAKEKVLQKFINGIKFATNEEKEFIAQQELEIKTLKAYPSEAKKMLDSQRQMAEANQEVSEKSKELVNNLENTTAKIEDAKEEIKEVVSITKDIDIDTLKDNLGRTWQQIADEEKKALSKMKEDLLFFELNNMEMDGIYSDKNDASEKRYKAANYMDTTNFTAKNKKEAIDLLSEYYAKTLILHQLKQKEDAILASQISNEDKIKVLEEERTSLIQRRKTYSEEELEALKKSKDNADEYYKSVKEASTEFAKLEEHAKSLNIKKEAIPQHIDGLIMQGMYYEQLGQSYKPLKEIGVDQTKLIQENEKSRTALSLRDSATNAYEKALESNKENAKIDARVAEIDKEIAQLKGEQTQEVEQQINVIEQQTEEVKQQANIVEQQKEDIQEQAIVIEQQTEDVKEQTNAIQEQAKVEEQKQVIDEKSKQIKQDKVEVENEEVKALQEQIAKNEELIKQEEEAMQDAKETATMHEMEVATINYKIKQAKELRDEQEKQLANANENNAMTEEEKQSQAEAIQRINDKIKALEEERQTKLKMADDIARQIAQEKTWGDLSDDRMNELLDNYGRLRKEANQTEQSINMITRAIQEQSKYAEMSRTGVNPLQPINNSPQSSPNWTTGGRGGSNGGNVPPRTPNGGGNDDGGNIPPDLGEYIKLKQRALMLDIENLVYGKELTDNQKLMVNELVEQVVQLGRSVTSMKELSFEVQKIKQNINETKFDVKVTTTEDKNAKKLLEQQRKEKELMYKGLFDQRIAEIEAEEKYTREMTNLYTKLFDQAERNIAVEERAKVVLEDKVNKQKELWQLKVKEFSQSDNGGYADPKDITNMKEMANNIGNNVTNMRELNLQLHEMNVAYKEVSSNAKNTKAMYNDAEKQAQQAEKEAEALRKQAEAEEKLQQKLKELIATKEEDLRQTHQSIQNNKVYRNATESQRMAFDALRKELKLTGETTEEVNAQYKKLTQQMNGMKLNMVTSQLNQHESIFKKVINTMKQYVTMNFDVMDMFNYLQRGFQNAFEHIKTLDEAYTNISMTMDVTNKQFQTMVDTAMEVGNANGQLETEVLNMMKVYANAGTTVEEINKQMKATVAFQNVSDLDASSVTQSIQTIIQQYKLLDSGAMDAAEATEYLGDVMVAVAYNLAKEESVAMQEVISGIETAGNMIKTSGGSFEWFTSVIGTLSEVMNASGSETANAMKMIAARTLKSKEAIEDLADSGEDMEDIEIAASNAEKALNSIGLSARNSNGDFKDLEVILGEVAAKWDTLNNSTKQYVSEQLAGNNRRSFFIGLMENYDRTMELQQIAENSSGQLMEASEKKAESLEGRLNKLQNAWTGLYQSMLNSDFTKGAISGLTDIINGVSKVTKIIKSTLIPTLTLATAAWVAYKIAMIEASGGFMTFGGMVAPLIGKLTTLKTTLIATTQAILGSATAMTILGGAVAGLAVFGIAYNYGKKLQEQMDAEYYTTEELSTASETLTNKMNALADAKDRLATTSADLDVLEVEIAKMNSENTSLERKQKLHEDINSKIKQYANEYPDLRGILLDENRSYQDRIEYLQRTLELEKDIAAQEAQKTVQATSMSDYETKINEGLVQIDSEQIYGSMYEEDPVKAAEWQKQKLSEMMTVYAEATNRALELKTLLKEGLITQEFYDTEIASLQRLEEALMNSDWASQIFGDNFKVAIDGTIEYAKQLIPSLQSVFDGDYNADSYTDALNDLNEAMKDTEFSVVDTEEALKILTKAFPELEGHVDDLSGVIDYLSNQAMLELAEQADQANSILSEMASEDFTGFDTSSAQELLSMYPELANHIQDAAYVQDFLNDKVREYQDEIDGLAENGSDAWAAYYDNVLAQDADFWANKLANSDQWADYEKLKQQEMQEYGANILGIEAQDFADYIDAKGGFREVDYTNCENAAQAEATLSNSLANDMTRWFADYISEKGLDRQTDMTNVVEFLNTQGAKEAQTIDELKTMWASYYSAKKAAVNTEISELNKKIGQLNNLGRNADSLEGFEDMIMGNHGVSGAAKHQAASLAGKLTQLERDNTNFENFFAAVDSTFGSIGDGLSQISATADEISNNFGGGGSGFKPKSTGSGSGGSGGRGGSGSGGKGSSGSNSTEKEVEDLDLRIDKYTELEEAIKRAEEALSRNQEAQEAVTTKAELKKLLEQEIELMNKKKAALEKLKQAQIQEQQSLKSYLQRAGLIFNGDELVGDKVTGGSVTDRLKDAQNWANKASGAEKEWRIKDTQYLKEQIDTYYDLMNSIGSTQGSLNDLNLEIRNAKKEHEKLLKAVENLSDRYLQITMRLERLNSELSINQRKQELAVGQELVSLRNRELQILKEKKALNQQNANELKEEQKELQDYLYRAGLRFAKDGTMTNYDQLWSAATNKYNTLAGVEAEDYKEFLDEIAEKTDRYLEILNSELPQVEEDLLDIVQTEKELAKQQEEYAEQLRDLAYNYNYLFQVTQKLTKAEQELSLLESKMEHASYEERLDILERQEEIYKSQLKLLEEQKRIQESMNRDRRNDLMKIGFEFDEDGFIKNYDKVVGAMYDKIQSTEGGAVRDEMIEDYDDLIAKVEDYNNSLANIKDSENSWWDINNAIKDAQQEQLNLVQEVQDSIKDAITNKWQETTDNLKKELEKQKELLDKQWAEEDWEDELTDAQDELNKIQAQINNLSKDTSLAGQLKLEQLKEEYKTQLEAMNEMIKDHEREMTNQVFEDESQRLDDEMEEALKTEQLMQSVNQALSTGFVTIGEQAIKLNDLLVDQLKEAKELWGDIASLGQAITNKTPSTAQLNSTRKTSSTVNTNAPLINVSITGDLDSKITLDDINRITKQASEDVMVKLYELMK